MQHELNFRVTDTQKLIVEKALESARGPSSIDRLSKEELIERFVRMMVIIQSAGMGAYFHRGLQWSWRSRNPREPQQVALEALSLQFATDCLHVGLDHAKGKAACRIRENRARRERELIAEPGLLPENHPDAYMLH